MKFTKTNEGFLIRILKGEKVVETLANFCKSENITSGVITGIGSASDIELGYYDTENKEYHWKLHPNTYEILSINGNVSLVDNQPFIHLHTVISDENYQTLGGHLKEAVCGATIEVWITKINISLSRVQDDEIGLKLLDLDSEFENNG